MAFRVKFNYPDGREEIMDEVFEEEWEAEDAAQYECDGFSCGEDILDDCNMPSESGFLDYEIYEE